MKKLKYLAILPITMISMATMVTVMMKMDHQVDYDVSTDGLTIPTFTEMDIPFDQKIDPNASLPFAGSAVIDIDNDGQEELFLGGGPNQKDKFFSFQNGAFVDVSDQTGFTKAALGDATFGVSVVDVDKNGFSDLIIARTNGVWLYSNEGGKFTAKKLDITFNSATTPLSVGVSDINRDGHVDLFVAGYMFRPDW